MVKTYAHRGEDNATLADLVIGRGLSCDKAELLGILDAVGYYRFKGYLVPFYVVGSESFKTGTRLSDIWAVYNFDRNLRECVLSGIARLEVALRAMIVRCACQMDADPLAYTRDSFFPRLSAYERADLLLRIAKAVHQAKNEPFLEYAIKQYGFSDLPPIWTMMEVIPMGTLIALYRGLPESVQAAISNAFHVRPAIFVGWFTMIRKVRNVCAHHGRLWNRHIQNPLTHKVGSASELAGIEECIKAQRSASYSTVFTAVSVVAYLMSVVRPQSKWRERCRALLESADPFVLTGMGVPANWQSLALWQ